MIAFIICSSLLALLVLNQSEYLPLLASQYLLDAGIGLMAISLLLGYFKKARTIVWHDGFATASLMIWYPYWKPEFSEDSPMFFIFPLYFAFITAAVTLALIVRSSDFDRQSIDYLRYINKITRFNIGMSIGFVIIGLAWVEHYAIYPMAMTYFIFRHTLTVCLENIDA